MNDCITSCHAEITRGSMTEPPETCGADTLPHEELCAHHDEIAHTGDGHLWEFSHVAEECCPLHCELDHGTVDADAAEIEQAGVAA